ncbi:hypothetical protein CC79DRAFT_365081 [Sarocladium strictum]
MPAHASSQPHIRRFRLRQSSPTPATGAPRRRSASPVRHAQTTPASSPNSLTATARGGAGGQSTAAGTATASSEAAEPPKSVLSCERCRSFKKKCSRTIPTCLLCANSGKICSLSKPPTSPSDQVSELEARVAWLTSIINAGIESPTSRRIDTVKTGTQLSALYEGPLRRAYEPPAGNALVSRTYQPTDGYRGAKDGQDSLPSLQATSKPTSQLRPEAPLRQVEEIQGPSGIVIDGPTTSPCSNNTAEVYSYQWSIQGQGKRPSITSSSPTSSIYGIKPDTFARQCVHAYFQHVHRAYPFVDKTKIEAEINSIDNWDQLGSPSSAYSTLTHLVMAIGWTTLRRAGKLPDGHTLAFQVDYASIVQECLGRDNLESLQILVLVALYSLFDSVGISAWAVAGIASRQAVLLGLSRKASEEEAMSSVEVEIRHRLFWSIWVLDRMMAFSLGMPVALTDESHDIPLPGLTVEEFASLNRQTITTMLQTNRHIIQLRQLEDRILRQVLLRKPSDVAAMSHVDCRALTNAIRANIEDWYSNGCLVSHLDADSVPIHGSIAWSSSRYYHLLFFLYYPCSLNLKGHKALAKELFPLAQKALQLNSVLLQQRQLPLNWVTLCRLFPVGLVLMHCLAQNETQQAARGSARQDITTIVHLFEAFSSSWTEAHEAAKIFRYFMQSLSLTEMMGERLFASTGGQQDDTYNNNTMRRPSTFSAEPVPLLRSSILKFTELMKRTLGIASCYLFEELSISEQYGNHAMASSSLDTTLFSPPLPIVNGSTSGASPGDDGWQCLDLAFL